MMVADGADDLHVTSGSETKVTLQGQHQQEEKGAAQGSVPQKASARHKPGQPIRVDDLYGSSMPPTSPKSTNSVSGNQPEEIKSMFIHEYALGIDLLLETDWYTRRGIVQLMQDGKLRSTFAGLLDIMRTTQTSDYEAIQRIPPIESKVTWRLMCMPRAIYEKAKIDKVNPFTDLSFQEVLYRLHVLEALICNRQLQGDFAVWPPDNINANTTYERKRQLRFWRLMGALLALPPGDRGKIEAILNDMRSMLDVHENRDALYSIAVVRHFGLAPPPQPKTLAEAAKHTRDLSSQKIAKKFIEDMAAHKGTNQVMQRICGMVVRSWAIQGMPFYY